MKYQITSKDCASNSVDNLKPVKTNVKEFIDFLKRYWTHYWNFFDDVEIKVHYDDSIIIIAENKEGWLYDKIEISGLTPNTYQKIQGAINNLRRCKND